MKKLKDSVLYLLLVTFHFTTVFSLEKKELSFLCIQPTLNNLQSVRSLLNSEFSNDALFSEQVQKQLRKIAFEKNSLVNQSIFEIILSVFTGTFIPLAVEKFCKNEMPLQQVFFLTAINNAKKNNTYLELTQKEKEIFYKLPTELHPIVRKYSTFHDESLLSLNFWLMPYPQKYVQRHNMYSNLK